MDAGHVLGEGRMEEDLPAVVAAAGAQLLQLVAEDFLLPLLQLIFIRHLLGWPGLPDRLLRLAVRYKCRVAGLKSYSGYICTVLEDAGREVDYVIYIREYEKGQEKKRRNCGRKPRERESRNQHGKPN